MFRTATYRAAVALSLLAAPSAAQQTYFGQGAGATAAGSDFAHSLGLVSAPDLTGHSGATLDFGAPFGVAALTGGVLANGRVDVSGHGTTPALTVRFAGPLTGFGATFTDVGSCCAGLPFADAVLTLTFLNGATTVGTVVQQFGTTRDLRGLPAFFGVSGLAAFDRVEVRTNDGDAFSVRGPVVGTAAPVATVPEPGSLALLVAGLGGAVAAAQSRRRRTE